MISAKSKVGIRGWLSGRPWLLEAVFRLTGKPYTEIVMFRSLVRPGDTVFDLGANTGQYTCLFCRLAGPSGAVHAFEPIPTTFATLKWNATRHSKKCPLALNNFAVGETEGTIKMFVADGRFTEASMVQHTAGSVDGQHSVANYDCPVITVDSYMKKNNIGKVDLIKCDVEGAELLAMKGAEGSLSGKNPPVLFLEAWSQWTKDFGYQPADLFVYLERVAGYAIYHVYKGKIKKISPHDEFPADSFPDFLNFLCVVPSVHGDRLRSLNDAGLL